MTRKSGMNTGIDIGGHPMLDFINTCGGSGKARDNEQITDWDLALKWARHHGFLTSAEQRALRDARPSPDALLDALIDFRETAYVVFSAIATGARVPRVARLSLQTHVAQALAQSELVIPDAGLAYWKVLSRHSGTALIKDRLALAANALLAHSHVLDVRECSACSWLFLDLSRGKSRRWCSMATCGNRAKAQRHYVANKQPSAARLKGKR